MSAPAAAAQRDASTADIAREFWRGVSRPSFLVASAALALAVVAWIAVIAGSTSAHVRRTPAEQWARNPIDDYAWLTARCIQGAAQHAQGADTIVFVGPSIMREALPDERALTAILTDNRPAPLRAVKLCGNSLGILEIAAVIDKFGADFRGVFVVGVNRHMLNRGIDLLGVGRVGTDGALGFASPAWEEEVRRAGATPPRRIGWEFWDDRAFYIRTMGGWRYAWSKPPEPFPHFFWPGKRPTLEKIRGYLPPENDRARSDVLGALARIGERLRAAGTARLVVVELPWADSATPALHDAAWLDAERRHITQMKAWSESSRVPWVDARPAMQLQTSDYCDVLHIVQTEARTRVARALAAPLHAALP